MTPRNRRIDRITDPSFVEDLGELSLDDLRARRDECLAEREYLSMLRRLLQGRAEILKAALEARGSEDDAGPLVERLAQVLADDEHLPTSRGEAVRISVPEEEMLLARRRVERLVSDIELSDPARLDDETLRSTIETLVEEEREVSGSRRSVLEALDGLQGELKRRYKDDPSLALR
jgi:hypothetical protein